MNAKIFLLTLLVAISVVGLNAYAANCPVTTGWCSIGFYYHWYNVSSVNWNYTNAFGTQQPVSWALMKFNTSSLGNAAQLNIQGYSNSIQNLGAVPYIFITNNFGTTVIEVSKYTISGYAWNSISVFYNPTSSSVQGIGAIVQSAQCLYSELCQPYYKGQLFKIWITPTTSLSLARANGAVIQDCLTLSCLQIINVTNLNYPLVYANSIYAMVNFTTQQPFVVITNRSMTGNYFNLTFNTGLFNQYKVNTTASNYQLNSGSASVTNALVPSYSSNAIFGNFSGFEGFFATTGNAIISEGMSTRSCFILATCIYNSLNTGSGVQLTQSSIQLSKGYFQLKVGTQFPTTYYILPAFSTTFSIGNSGNYFTNSNPIINQSINSSQQGWYYDFTNRTLIYGINWTYDFTTSAFPNSITPSISVSNTINFGAGNVSYALISMPHYRNFGDYCQDTYLRAFINGSNPYTPEPLNEDLGAINYYFLNCTPTSANVELLVPNMTVEDIPFYSFYIYSDSASNFTNRVFLEDISVVNAWQFDRTDNQIITGNSPYLINLNSPLTPNSAINLHWSSGVNYSFAVNGMYDEARSTYGVYGSQFIKDLSGFPSTQFLAYQIGMSGNPDAMFSTTLGIYKSGTTDYIRNSTNGITYGAGFSSDDPVNISLSNISATLEHLYTSDYRQGQTQQIRRNLNNCSVYCLPNLPINNFGNTTNTKTGLNYTTNSTTIPFNGLNATKVVLTTGVSIPEYWIFVIEIILIIICAGLFEATKDGHVPFAIMLVGQWLIALFALNWTLVIIAVVVTLVFVIYEFTPHEKREVRINKQR